MEEGRDCVCQQKTGKGCCRSAYDDADDDDELISIAVRSAPQTDPRGIKHWGNVMEVPTCLPALSIITLPISDKSPKEEGRDRHAGSQEARQTAELTAA